MDNPEEKASIAKLEIGMRSKCGFTLIELLVVLVIIGITLTFALLSFGDFGAKRRLVTQSEQLINQIKCVQQQAMLEATPFSIRFATNSYRIFRFKPPQQWVPIQPQPTSAQHIFSAHAIMHFSSQSSPDHTTLLIESSGDMSPFELSVGFKQQPKLVTIIGSANGTLTLTQSNAL